MKNIAFCERRNDYGKIPQRWVVVESEKRRQSELKQIEKKIEKSLIINKKGDNFTGIHEKVCNF